VRVVIVGAGEVGSNIASNLSPTHEVVVVDVDPDRVEEITYSLDVLAIEGNGASLETLTEAEVGQADLLIASTDDDEANLVICGTAKAIGDPFTIARVKEVNFLRTWERSRGAFGVDFMVCSDLLTAEDVVQVLGLPAAVNVERFTHGLVQMAEFELVEDSPLVGRTVSQADTFEALTFAAVVRNREIEFPRGDTTLSAGDRIVVIGTADSVHEFAQVAAPSETQDEARNVLVVGGSEIGFHTARLLRERGYQPRLVEQDGVRAREIAEELPDTVVLENDATDTEFLEREHIGEADAVVTALGSDQKNLLVSLLAKQLGVKRTIAVVEDGEYQDLFEAVGVDVSVNPRIVTGEEITRFTRQETAEKLAFIESERAEVLEIEVGEDSVLADRPISESTTRLPSGVVIGAITREHETVTPRGDTVIRVGDHVVLFVDADVAEEVSSLV
jgi:trk system potassium uptake protein TrkA